MSNSRDGRRLARGLSALMSDAGLDGIDAGSSSEAAGTPRMRLLPIDRIVANEQQPRQTFDPEEMEDLASSVRARGILQPLIVRRHPIDSERYQIVAGERRWRAAQIAGLHEVPVVVRTFDDGELLEVAIIENIQRADLNPIEEAQAYRGLMDRHGHTQEQLGAILGRSRSHVANVLRLVNLPEPVQEMLRQGEISAGHARAILSSEHPVDLAAKVVAKQLSVRDTERLAKQRDRPGRAERSVGGAGRAAGGEKDADTRMIEGDLGAALKMAVTIKHGAPGEGGVLSVRYHDLEQLDALCELLSHGLDR